MKLLVKWFVPGLMAALGGVALAPMSMAFAGSNSAPATLQIAQNQAQAGSIVTLQSPRIDDYWVSATRQSGGVIVFDGYAPDEATRDRLSLVDNADTNFLKLGRGAPENYQAAVDFGLSVLARLSEGRFALRGSNITLTGLARSSADYAALADLIASGPPPNLTLASDEIKAPPATPYRLLVTKGRDGSIAITGMLPNPAAKASLAASEARPSVVAITYASGEPAGLVDSATLALRLIRLLESGTATYNGTGWTVSGTAATTADQSAIEVEFATRQLAAAGWTLDITMPPVKPAAPEIAPPTAAPTAPIAEPEITTPAAPITPPQADKTPVITEKPAPKLATPPALEVCQTSVAEFSARNAILFKSGAAVIAPESAAVLDQLAASLALCPEADVEIEGHTDTDGDDQLNLALSVARAEAVVNALISRQISAQRLYAVGYGESQPIADNATSAGKSLNRRIVVKVLEHKQK